MTLERKEQSEAMAEENIDKGDKLVVKEWGGVNVSTSVSISESVNGCYENNMTMEKLV